MSDLELRALAQDEPEKLRRALLLEENARPNFTKIEGLWRKSLKKSFKPGSWVEWAIAVGLATREDDDFVIHPPAPGTYEHPDAALAREVISEMALAA